MRAATILVLVATVAAATACGADGDGATPNALSGQAARGAELYRTACASCHGTDLRGTDKGPSHLSEVYKPSHHGDEAFVLAARLGVRAHHWNFGDMAPVAGLDDDELVAIVAYVREVQAREGFEPYPPR
jgi:mono/diheme cytochrome c family protein